MLSGSALKVELVGGGPTNNLVTLTTVKLNYVKVEVRL